MHKYKISYIEHFSAKEPINIMEIGHEICDKNYHIFRNTSPIYAMEFIVSGNNSYTINQTSFIASSGDVVLLPKNSFHNYKNHTEQCEKIWCVFDGKLVENLLTSYLNNGDYIFHCPKLYDDFIAILDTAKDPLNTYEEIQKKLSLSIHKIFLELRFSTKIKATTSIAQQIIKHIDDNICKPFSLKVLSDKFNYSKNHIILLFKQIYGITPNK